MLGSLILYLKGMRRMMFQLSGFYYSTAHSSAVRLGDLRAKVSRRFKAQEGIHE